MTLREPQKIPPGKWWRAGGYSGGPVATDRAGDATPELKENTHDQEIKDLYTLLRL